MTISPEVILDLARTDIRVAYWLKLWRTGRVTWEQFLLCVACDLSAKVTELRTLLVTVMRDGVDTRGGLWPPGSTSLATGAGPAPARGGRPKSPAGPSPPSCGRPAGSTTLTETTIVPVVASSVTDSGPNN